MRYRQYLYERYCALLGYAGQILTIIGALHLVPLLLIPFYPDEVGHARGFLFAAVPLIIIGVLFWVRLTPPENLNLTVQEGSVIIVVIWIVSILCSTVPYMVNMDLNFTHALFESSSGWTSTGLSVIPTLDHSRLMLFFRSFLQFAGAAGFAIIAVSALTGMIGMSLSLAEGRTDQLAPHVRHSAAIVLRIYIAYTLFGIIALVLAGMDVFDAVNHAFAAIATGGFSTRPEGVAYWDSAAVEAILIILMLLGSINFVIAYTFLKGKYRVTSRNGEVRFMVVVLVLAIALILLVTLGIYPTAEKAVRVAVFEAVSAMTTTGFSLTNYHQWQDFGWLIVIVLMVIGGGSGSTAGGIKLFRAYILYKSVVWEVRRAFMPAHMINEPAIWQGERRSLLNDRQIRQVALFIAFYVTVFLAGSGLMAAYGYPLKDSLFEFASTMGGVGMSVGVTSINTPGVILWSQSIAMLLGRLELFALIVGVFKIINDVKTLVIPGGAR